MKGALLQEALHDTNILIFQDEHKETAQIGFLKYTIQYWKAMGVCATRIEPAGESGAIKLVRLPFQILCSTNNLFPKSVSKVCNQCWLQTFKQVVNERLGHDNSTAGTLI